MGEPGFVKWFLQKLGKLKGIFSEIGSWLMPEQIAGSAAQAAYCQAVKRHSLAQLRQPDIAAAKRGCREMMALIKEGVTDDGHTLLINLSPKKKKDG